MAENEPDPDIDAARFAAIIASSSDAIISKSLDGTVQTWNPAAEALFGWSAAEMVGQSIRRIVPEDRAEEEDRILARIRAGQTVPKFSTERLTKSGETVPIAVTVSPVRDASGRIVGASKIANDLREQIELQSGLREKTDQFTALANNIPQLAWLADKDGWIYWFNQRWYDFTGTDLEEMQGWGWQKVHHPDHVERVTTRIQEAWDSGEPWDDTFPLRSADGEFRWFLSRANPLRDDEGNVVLWCGTNTDITDQLEAQNHIKLLMREVNHRSRNMLATIRAILRRSSGLPKDELVQSLDRRINALASNQEILDGGDWSGARVADIVHSQLRHLGECMRQRIDITIPSQVIVRTDAAEAIGLAIHELATNAEKYGALSNDRGRVEIEWEIASEPAGEPVFRMGWTERNGPQVSEPSRTGFGSMLIVRNVEQVLAAKVKLDFAPGGLSWQVEAPARKLLVERIERVATQDYLLI
ncbi:PAS domain S-box protein [Qipengyuania sp. XHP0207]|uniref:PAS domain S-box protein n=1 Tax=Qipengyuania sp. XHP0207 TaxID=3038078 RepID=UPI00241F98EA|nr:PAS domain S-box protein [Qipengyuania sp. XHP0207]MDG5748895.1 PAS domain S-box protein [Qipengyuania sp. XHP0207]